MSHRRIITPVTLLLSWGLFGAGSVFCWAALGTGPVDMIAALVFTAFYSVVVWINGFRPEQSRILDAIDEVA